MMNILFLCKNFKIGGVETVTSILSRKFIDKGCDVVIAVFNEPDMRMKVQLAPGIKMYVLHGLHYSDANVSALKSILEQHRINIVINQWGLPFLPMLILKRAAKNSDIRIISVYHNTPNANNRLKKVEWKISNARHFLSKSFLRMQWYIYRIVTGISMSYVYRQSDIYLLLSRSYIHSFEKFIFTRRANKVRVLPNPVTVDNRNYHICSFTKRKEILYVGRLEYYDKRVDRLIDTWALLEKEYPDWCLTIIGEGPEKSKLRKQVLDSGLKRVTFEGFKDPTHYYERASILILTSEYEGFPLVLAECMSFGVIPVVYGCFQAVHDIISDNEDGFVLKYDKQGYSPLLMKEKMKPIMTDGRLRDRMAVAAVNKSSGYSVDAIADSWIELFHSLYNVSQDQTANVG